MKIALMVHRFHPEIGGVEMTAEILARGFTQRHGDEVTVITHTTRTDPEVTFPFRVLREPTKRELFAAIAQADVVFHNNPCMQFYWPQLFLRRPWVVAVRMWITLPGQVFTGTDRLKYALKTRMVESADVLVANSAAVAGHLRGVERVIHNSYRDSVFTVTETAPRDRRKLAFVGRLSADKGIEVLLDALALLRERGQDAHLTIIGEGDLEAEVRERISALDLTGQVRLTGRLSGPDTAAELNRHGIGVVPSTVPESFGTVALEEAACGLVVAVTGQGGLLEAIGDAGPTFPAGDATALADVLEELIVDDDYYEGYRRRIPAHVAAHREDIMVDAYRQVLARAVNSPESTRGWRGTTRQLRRFLAPGRSRAPSRGTAVD